MNGPTHPYMESSPGCWHVYGEILARQFSDPGLRDVQRFTADTYAVQHPGRPSPVAIQSVCGHLMSLCVVLETHAPSDTQTSPKGRGGWQDSLFGGSTPPRSLGNSPSLTSRLPPRLTNSARRCTRGPRVRGLPGRSISTRFARGTALVERLSIDFLRPKEILHERRGDRIILYLNRTACQHRRSERHQKEAVGDVVGCDGLRLIQLEEQVAPACPGRVACCGATALFSDRFDAHGLVLANNGVRRVDDRLPPCK